MGKSRKSPSTSKDNEEVLTQVQRVTVAIENGQRERDWVLGVLTRRHGNEFNAMPQGDTEIVVTPLERKELFFLGAPGANDVVPIFRAGDSDVNFGLSGYCEETRQALRVSISEVIEV